MKHKNILVLGGAGYIGSVVVEKLTEGGYNPIVYDNLSKGHREAVDIGCTFVKRDISDKELLNKTIRKYEIDAVMHFCALIEVEESVKKPELYFKNNVIFGLNVLEAMKENNVKKIIFSSTAAVYGEPKSIPIKEDDPTKPTNPYGYSKLMFEKLLKSYSENYGISFVSLRYFNACGASEKHGEDHKPESHLIPIVLETAFEKRESVKIYGDDYKTKDGTCVRDYIHVLDLASAHILALEYDKNGVFNLGNSKGFSVKEVIDVVREVTGKEIKAEVVGRRKGDSAVLVASSELIKKQLGWEPKHGLKEIISSAWEWKKKFPEGY
jgi:UDP-glucose 4-epimerase